MSILDQISRLETAVAKCNMTAEQTTFMTDLVNHCGGGLDIEVAEIAGAAPAELPELPAAEETECAYCGQTIPAGAVLCAECDDTVGSRGSEYITEDYTDLTVAYWSDERQEIVNPLDAFHGCLACGAAVETVPGDDSVPAYCAACAEPTEPAYDACRCGNLKPADHMICRSCAEGGVDTAALVAYQLHTQGVSYTDAAMICAGTEPQSTPEPTDPRTLIARAALPTLRAALPVETVGKRASKAHNPNSAYTALHSATLPRVAAACRYRPGLVYVLSPFDCALDSEDFTIIGYNKALILALLPAERPAADVCFLTDDSLAEQYRGDVAIFAAGDPSDLVCSGTVAARLIACGLVPSYSPPPAPAGLDRPTLARQAFYGGLPALADYLMEQHGYSDLDGHHRANCADLAEYCAWVADMPAEVLAIFVAPDPELAGLLASEAAHKATVVAGQEWLNHRYGADLPTYAAALYHAQELETQIHRAYIAVCMPL